MDNISIVRRTVLRMGANRFIKAQFFYLYPLNVNSRRWGHL